MDVLAEQRRWQKQRRQRWRQRVSFELSARAAVAIADAAITMMMAENGSFREYVNNLVDDGRENLTGLAAQGVAEEILTQLDELGEAPISGVSPLESGEL